MPNPPALPFQPQLPGDPGPGVGGHVVAMDLFVMINLGLLFFMLGFFACWAWLIWRRTHRPEPHMKLIMELADDPDFKSALEKPADEAPRAPWEREQDWWRRPE